ncbi:Endolytic murein transglycosylase [Nocardiopsis dassonvillei]|uniref:endolytic transglycosylase MltG n=1 Tax=Nocardiopsis dassonvillei TaxID=2014 RepID=UPI003F54B657
MNDRDDYPDDPSRGRADRDSGRDYDPLGGPAPARGRRARQEGSPWAEPGEAGPRRPGPPTGEFRTPRYAPRPDQEYDPLSPGASARGQEPPAGPPRRGGAADALRGGRAARSGAGRSRDAGPGGPGGPERPPAADPTQDALAALAGLGSPAAPGPSAEDEPRRARRGRTRPEPDPEPPAPAEDEPRAGRRARRGGTEEPQRRGRGRKRGRRDEEPGFLDDLPADTGAFDAVAFPGVNSSADTGAFAALSDEDTRPRRARGGDDSDTGAFDSTPRRGRRHRGGAAEEASEPVEEPRRSGRRRRGPVEEPPAEGGAFIADAPPRGRRARRAQAPPQDAGSYDTGSFGGSARDTGSYDTGSYDTGSFGGSARDTGSHDAGSYDTGSYETDAFADGPADTFAAPAEEEARPRSRRSRRGGEPDEAPRSRRRRGAAADEEPEDVPEAEDTGFTDGADDEEPAGRRGRGRGRRAGGTRRGGRKRGRREEEPEEEPREAAEAEPADDDYDYEEPALSDIAEAYGGGRSSRKKAKELKRARLAQQQRTPEGRRAKRRGKGMMILLVLALIATVGGGGFFVMRTYVFPPDFNGEGSGEVVYVIQENQSGLSVGQGLTDLGVVASPRAFTNALEDLPEDELGQGLVPGSYSLALGMSADNAVRALLDPANRLGGRVTIAEGLRNEQALEKLSEETGVPYEELEEAHSRPDELGLPEYAEGEAAGYLFPSTYMFDPDTDALTMLRTMVGQFNTTAEELRLEERAEEMGFTPDEIMAVASIVQAESGGEEDMPKVSRVIYNRLDIDMNLGMDSTCFYAIGEYGIALNNDQLAACAADTSGFDTYHKPGLPPGPFVAPGEDAIEAALEPAEGPWLYFVATDPENGVTEFTDSEAEFELLKQEFMENWSGG